MSDLTQHVFSVIPETPKEELEDGFYLIDYWYGEQLGVAELVNGKFWENATDDMKTPEEYRDTGHTVVAKLNLSKQQISPPKPA